MSDAPPAPKGGAIAIVPARDAKGRLLPGSPTMNPGGRPKGLEKLVREMVDWERATAVLTDILYGKLSGACRVQDRLRAYELLAQRAYGQPKAVVQIDQPNAGALNLAGRSTEELLAARETLRRILEGNGAPVTAVLPSDITLQKDGQDGR